MSQNSPVKILYHGSTQKIDRMLTMHRGRNPDKNSEGNQFGIYATPDLPTAKVYSMGTKRTTLFRPKVLDISYSKDCILVFFRNCCWDRKAGYVYIVSGDTFTRHNDFEYCSHQDALPSSHLLRTFYSIIDKLVHCVATVSHCFYVVRYKY